MAGPVGVARGNLLFIKDEVQYYQHQVDGIRQMANMGSCLLADDMGLGKTLEALTVVAIDFERAHCNRALVISPASIKWNWQSEIEKFTNFSSHILDGTPAQRAQQLHDFDKHVLIVNYEQVTAHLDDLLGMGFGTIIMDEAHYIKGYKTKRTKACLKLKAKRFLLCTGSPVLNHVDDLWALLHRIDPVEYPTYWRFVNRYAVYGGFKGKSIIGVKNEKELSGKLQTVMVRRRKNDVLDLPRKQYIPVVVPLHPLQEKLYRQARDELLIEMPDDMEDMEIDNALVKYLRLKQILGTTACLEGYEDHSYKLARASEMVWDIVREAGEHTVVFTQFRGVQDAFMKRCEAAGLNPIGITGDTPMEERVPIVNNWAAGPPRPLVAMLQVAGVGLNMTKASKCIFLDKLYSPKMNEQAEDRLHRIGADETRPVQIFHLYCKGTVEDRIEEILNNKTKVNNSVVETSDWKRALIRAMREKDDI